MSDPSTAVAIGPLVQALEPLVQTAVATAVGAVAIIALTTWNRWLGKKTTEDQKDAIRKAAATEAGVMVAEASDNLAGRSISVSNPAVAAAAAHVIAAAPLAVNATGVTSADVSRLVAGEIGKLQALASPTAPAAK
jgi:hypothetical protein